MAKLSGRAKGKWMIATYPVAGGKLLFSKSTDKMWPFRPRAGGVRSKWWNHTLSAFPKKLYPKEKSLPTKRTIIEIWTAEELSVQG